MYLARFETEDDAWVQAVAELRSTAAPGSSAARAWWEEIGRQLASATRIDDATAARRIALGRDRRLRQFVSVTAPARAEADVRLAFARLTRLERLLGGSIELAATREAHDAMMHDLPPLHFSPADEWYSAAGVPLACDFRIGPALDDILAEAALAGRRVTYQVHARSFHATLEDVRSARKNALSLSMADGARASLVNSQESLALALGAAAALADEYVAVDDDLSAVDTGAILVERFRAQHAALGLASAPPPFMRDAHADELAMGIHRHDVQPLSAVEMSAAGVSSEQRDALLAWRPSARLEALLRRDGEDDDGGGDDTRDPPPSVPPARLPTAYDGKDPFAFVSYKRQDLPRIVPILEAVTNSGIPIWYDRGIPGGSEWDAVIEERLSRCRCVLLFASAAAVQSKYVRREVKFADAKDTPLMSVLLEDTPLAHGLEMLLTQYQMLDARAPDFGRRLESSLRRML